MARTVRIDVISDTVCPWCYVGKRRLEKAMSQFQGKADFRVRWLPFQLNPDAPLEGEDKLQLYERKFGKERVNSMLPMMADVFKQEGLPPVSYGGRTGNTFNSHRLIWKAGQAGPEAQNAVVDELFQSYFCQEKFINDPAVLLAAAKKAQIQDAEAFLASGEGTEEVMHELDVARKHRVSGVPFFIIDGQATLSGAQDPQVLAAAISKALSGLR